MYEEEEESLLLDRHKYPRGDSLFLALFVHSEAPIFPSNKKEKGSLVIQVRTLETSPYNSPSAICQLLLSGFPSYFLLFCSIEVAKEGVGNPCQRSESRLGERDTFANKRLSLSLLLAGG